jgi:peptidoglycan/xylan/chitin deacetylase (PgdA/CDA1 family)
LSIIDTSPPARTQALVCFDFEGRWGMPFKADYDLVSATTAILECLAEHGASAVFFVVGEIAIEHPNLIAAIAAGGHEIGMHGYRHERFAGLSDSELAEADAGMQRAEAVIERVSGRRPCGFRAPHLLAPSYYDPRVQRTLRSRGYRWTSNTEVRQPVELSRPDLLRTARASIALRDHPDWLGGSGARSTVALLNLRLCRRRAPEFSAASTWRWMRAGFAPFMRDGLIDIPVTGPLDCDVIGLPDPSIDSSPAELAYATFAMERSLLDRGGYAMLTFHDWVVAGGNRIGLLNGLLGAVRARGLEVVTGETASADQARPLTA